MHEIVEKRTGKPPLSSNLPRRVGIIGGMGPAATVDLMAKVLREAQARRDEDHVPLIVWNVPQVPSRPAAVRGEGPSPLPALLEAARFLESAGATALAIACNTAHHWAPELREAVSIPLLHIADATLEELAHRRPGMRSVALLGTRATLDLGIYSGPLHARGIAVRVPEEELQAAIDRAIAAVKAGDLDSACGEFVPVARTMLDRGAEAVVIGCTELPLIACPPELEARMVDPTLALARAIVRHARAAPCERLPRDVS
jgi:aspartate racemase